MYGWSAPQRPQYETGGSNRGFRGGGGRGSSRGRGGAVAAHRASAMGERSQGSDSRRNRPQICNKFAMQGQCKFGHSCRFAHGVINVGLQPDAHQETIKSAVIAPHQLPDGSIAYELFTAGKEDRCIKQWTILAIGGGGVSAVSAAAANSLFPADAISASPPVTRPSDVVKFEFKHGNSMQVDAAVSKLFLTPECLFCGLANGKIQVFNRRNGQSTALLGHEGEIQAFGLIEDVLVSADFKGKVMFWKGAIAPGTTDHLVFTLQQAFDFAAGVKCLQPTVLPSGSRGLWIGGVEKVGLLDLQTWQYFGPPTIINRKRSVCMDFLIYSQNLLAAFSTSDLRIFAANGSEIQALTNLSSSVFTTLAGVESSQGPAIVVGQNEGELMCFDLPSMTVKWEFIPHSAAVWSVVSIPASPTHQAFFLTAAADGCLALWSFAQGS